MFLEAARTKSVAVSRAAALYVSYVAYVLMSPALAANTRQASNTLRYGVSPYVS